MLFRSGHAMNRPHRLSICVVAAALFPMSLAACGSDTGSPRDASTPPANGSDSQYVDDVCAAAGRMFTAYQKSFQDNRESLGGMDPTDAYARTARQPFATLVAELERLTPPAEVAAGHEDTIRQAKEVLQALNQGDRQKLLALRGTPDTGTWKQVIDLSPALKDRFRETSLGVEACQSLTASGAGNPFR